MAGRQRKMPSFSISMQTSSASLDPLGGGRTRFSTPGNPWVPSADVADCLDHVVIRIEIPGIDPDDLLVLQNGRMLLVQGHRTRVEEEGETCLHLMEIQYGPFERAFELPEYLDLDDIQATYKNGFLLIRIKKSVQPPRETRVLQVRVQETS